MLSVVSGREGDRIKIEVTIDLSGSMLGAEESILKAANSVGNLATEEVLKRFDADGEPITIGNTKDYPKASSQKSITLHMGSSQWNGRCIRAPREARRSVQWITMRGS